MEKSVYFSHGTLRSTRVHFAICPGGHVRLKPGMLPNGSIIVDGRWTGTSARLNVLHVQDSELVKVGQNYEPITKSAIFDVVKQKLLSMPNKLVVFATEIAWRAIMARQELE